MKINILNKDNNIRYIYLDVNMPVMNGIDTYKTIRQYISKDIIIYFVSSDEFLRHNIFQVT